MPLNLNLKDQSLRALNCVGRTIKVYVRQAARWVERIVNMDNIVQVVSLYLFLTC